MKIIHFNSRHFPTWHLHEKVCYAFWVLLYDIITL